eukprot:8690310-Pyramimonas_sp.AAC.1
MRGGSWNGKAGGNKEGVVKEKTLTHPLGWGMATREASRDAPPELWTRGGAADAAAAAEKGWQQGGRCQSKSINKSSGVGDGHQGGPPRCSARAVDEECLEQ